MRSMAILVFFILLLLAACGSPTGEHGPSEPADMPSLEVPIESASPTGEQRPATPAGMPSPEDPTVPAGNPGEQEAASEPVAGSTPATGAVDRSNCVSCHKELYDRFMMSGHAWKLNPVIDGQAPDYPYTEIPNPPEGYTWDDILYVIGGYNWKARFIDKDGYLISGDENAKTQYNFANYVIGNDSGWVAFHAGETEKVDDCRFCHTATYSLAENQDGLSGLIGSWSESDVVCEECHGPGNLHIIDPQETPMLINRDAEQCGQCHVRDITEVMRANGGFIDHHEQSKEIFQGTHVILDCVTCHDPHVGVIQLRQAKEKTTRMQCEDCHFEQGSFQDSQLHSGIVDCIDCHMPRIIKSAVGNTEMFTGDIRAHLMTIDPYQVDQFSQDGSTFLSKISLDFACRSCHVQDGTAMEKTDEQLIEKAIDYHESP